MSDGPSEAEEPQRDLGLGQEDGVLQLLVSIVNSSSVEIGITLQMSGFLVSGQLVGAGKYFERFALEFVGGSVPPPGTPTRELYESLLSFGQVPNEQNETPDNASVPRHIHLKEARFFNTIGKPI